MNNSFLTKNIAYYLANKYQTPLYVYDKNTIVTRCKEIRNMLKYNKYIPNYSAKANSNIELLKIIRKQGFTIDAMSIGEIELAFRAGFSPKDIMFIANNISKEEMAYALEKNICISLDSISQIETFGKMAKGREIFIRLNPGIGAGHHKKVITGGKSKFGIPYENIEEVIELSQKYNLSIVGINQHIGSLFLNDIEYIEACKKMLDVSLRFEKLQVIDFGGGFGVPYKEEEQRLDINSLGKKLDNMLEDYVEKTGKIPIVKVEPGRYIVAESGILLGTVLAVKENYGVKYIGTDIGFNVFMRPVLYNSFHSIEVYNEKKQKEMVTIVGNICESGDILAEDRILPRMEIGDVFGIKNTGAYGFSMSSNYNSRLKPAEVLIENNKERVIRKRETIQQLLFNE